MYNMLAKVYVHIIIQYWLKVLFINELFTYKSFKTNLKW